MPSTPARATGPNPDSQPSNSRCPAKVVGNSATPSNPPTGSSAAATLRSRCVSTPPVTRHDATLRSECVSAPPGTGRAASTMVTVIPSACEVFKGWRRRPTARRRCDRPVGAGRSTALRASAGAISPGPGRRIVLKTGNAVSRFSSQARTQARPTVLLHRPQGGGLSPIIPLSTTPAIVTRSASLHILPADSARAASLADQSCSGGQICRLCVRCASCPGRVWAWAPRWRPRPVLPPQAVR